MITISINPQTPAHMAILGKALIALLGDDTGPMAEATQEPAEETPAKRTRRTKEEPAAAQVPKSVAESAPSVEPVSAPVPTVTEQTKAITLEEVRAKLAALSQAGKTAAVKELIAKHGVSKLTDLKPEQYSAVLEEAGAL